MKTVLLATAATPEGILEMIHKFYCGTQMRVLDGGTIQRVSDNKILDSVRVIQKKGRYRFERIPTL